MSNDTKKPATKAEVLQLWEEVKNLLSQIFSGKNLEEIQDAHLKVLKVYEEANKATEAIKYLQPIKSDLEEQLALQQKLLGDEVEIVEAEEKAHSEPHKKAWGWVLGVLAFLVVAIGAIWLVGSMSRNEGVSEKAAQTSAPSATSTSSSSTTQSSEVEPFEILPEGANVEGKIISNNSSSNSLEGSLQQKVDSILYGAQHSLDDLQQGVKAWAIDVPKNIKWTEEKNGKTFLSREAQLLYYKYEEKLREFAKPEEVTNVAVSGYATGSQKGELVQDSTLRSYEGWSGVKFIYEDSKGDTYAVYYLDYCGNIVTPGHVVKKVVPLPIPPRQPEPPTPTPTPTPIPQPKDPKQDPAAQGQAPVGGGQNAGGTVSEAPSETPPSFPASYQAPAEQPAATTPSTGGGAGAATTPSTAIVNAPSGSFSDGNGTTTVSGSGAVTTPSASYGGLVNQTPPPVQNGTTTNSGVNNGSQNGTDIPMED